MSDRPERGVSPREARREDRFERRWRRGIATGAGVGLAVGLLVGLTIGGLWANGTAFWMALVGCTIAGLGIGAFIGGLSRLESPQPGAEPSQVARPVRDQPDLTTDEHTDPVPPPARGR
jgi:hypothetical protein